ncbi:Phosphatidylserine/phosphatidylglycerophosphate/cardiolipin synthase [Nocardioides terrae]|uniref:phospholipase D n=1 Tax=Nocardioides terrae TaxID=574651 RepID=A0A1I1DFN1_9ACTN|nr:phospholipase D-like domain-containing protein [Nocardioides terrae]SFB71333.1 Phosphatidylserine/phosphatidylglycerophosphate/cardiolipin synthase [Nocardioides terrae]
MFGLALGVMVVLAPQAVEVSGPRPLAAAAATPPSSSWHPKLGPVFNDPLGRPAAQEAIVNRLVKAINHTRRGSLIRIAVYSFDRGDILHALNMAHKRGVHEQVIVNKSVMSGGVAALQRKLGKNPNKRNFVVACNGRCRKKGSSGNMHSKVYTFSQTGAASYLVITGSGNLTSKGVYRQWNDSYGVAGDKALYDAWGVMFDQMAHQKRTTARRLSYTSGPYTYDFQRALASQGGQATTSQTTLGRYRPKADPAWRRIQQVSCVSTPPFGAKGHTVIRIAIYGMFGARGEGLAKALVKKKQQGCDIRIIMSVPGGHTYKMMERAKIPLRSGDWEFADRDAAQEDGISGWGPRFYSHLKFFAINGTYAGHPTKSVWTGSENWDSLSFTNEEVVLTLNDASDYRAYVDKWNSMWDGKATHKMGIQPLVTPQQWAAGNHRVADRD